MNHVFVNETVPYKNVVWIRPQNSTLKGHNILLSQFYTIKFENIWIRVDQGILGWFTKICVTQSVLPDLLITIWKGNFCPSREACVITNIDFNVIISFYVVLGNQFFKVDLENFVLNMVNFPFMHVGSHSFK